ncbi:MAG: flavodoxin family protein, partial [Armatimonadota bacterium]
TFKLHDLNYKGCYSCMACKSGSETCVIQDDLKPVLEAVAEADVVILASPIYFGQVSGQLKCFIDRTFSYLKPDFHNRQDASRLAPGKKMVFVLTQGDADASSYNVGPEYAGFYKFMGFETHNIRGLGLGAPTDAAATADLMQQAEDLARQIMA